MDLRFKNTILQNAILCLKKERKFWGHFFLINVKRLAILFIINNKIKNMVSKSEHEIFHAHYKYRLLKEDLICNYC